MYSGKHTLKIGKKKYQTHVLTDQKDQQAGMQGKTFSDFDALYFKFKRIENLEFHTSNCIVPLDIIIVRNRRIMKIHANCPPNSGEIYSGMGDAVIELPGTTVWRDIITIGQKVDL